MDRARIRRAAKAAQQLADELTAQIRASGIPRPHWEEVLERLKSNLELQPSSTSDKELLTQADALATLFKDRGAPIPVGTSHGFQSDLLKLLSASAQHIQLNAMLVADLPIEEREAAYAGIEARIRESLSADRGSETLKEEWLTALLSDLRWYVQKIDAGGGAQGGKA